MTSDLTLYRRRLALSVCLGVWAQLRAERPIRVLTRADKTLPRKFDT